MTGDRPFVGSLSVQDRDLIGRLSQYFDRLEDHLRDGQGWFIFGLSGRRAARVTQFVAGRLSEYQPLVSYYLVSWRDFALNAYIDEVELPGKTGEQEEQQLPERLRHEYDIALRVSRDTYYVMAGCDVLVISGLQPAHLHELRFLAKLVEGRRTRRVPTMLLTPRTIPELAEDFRALDPAEHYWQHLYALMYDTSLFAV